MAVRVELVSTIVNFLTIIFLSIGVATQKWKENENFSMGLFQICYQSSYSKTNKTGCHGVAEELDQYADLILGCRYSLILSVGLLFVACFVSIPMLCKRNISRIKALRCELTFGFIIVLFTTIPTAIFWIHVSPADTTYTFGFSILCIITGISLKTLETSIYNVYAVCCSKNQVGQGSKNQVGQGVSNDPFAPSFRLHLEDTAVVEGDTIQLLYGVTQKDKIRHINWSRNNERITVITDRSWTGLDSHGLGYLKISNAEKDDTGEYKCELIYSSDEVIISTCKVTIHPAWPVFKTNLENKKLSSGEDLSLTCTITRAEKIHWVMNNKDIDAEQMNSGKHRRISTSFAYNTATLMINNVTKADAGEYKCIARSWGRNPKTAIKSCIVNITGDLPPDFQVKPNTIIKVFEGNPLSISLRVLGYPQPKIKWYRKDEEVMPDNNTVMKFSCGFAILKLARTTKEDDGEYTCYAENEYGNEIYKFPVKVQSEQDGVNAECPVCQDRVPDVVLPCGHPLCRACANEIKRRGSNCPRCRAPFREYTRLYLQ